jgi:sugar phosphate isomerase/epimerase
MILGLSTGILVDTLEIKEILSFYKKIGCKAIELSPNHLPYIDKSSLEGFSYISTHARTDLIYSDNEETHQALKLLEKKHREIGFKCIVLHPSVVKDWKVFAKYKLPWVIENMDNINGVGITPEQILAYIKITNFNVVLDLNHCYTNDSTMELADKFYKILNNKIVELHMSGYKDSTNQGRHLPLHITKQAEILGKVKDIPIIIEIDSGTKESSEKEFNYLKKVLRKYI